MHFSILIYLVISSQPGINCSCMNASSCHLYSYYTDMNGEIACKSLNLLKSPQKNIFLLAAQPIYLVANDK